MTGEPPFEPERVVAALNHAAAEYVIVGGLAVAAHGYVRATRDLDLVPNDERGNMRRLAACLTALGGEHPITGTLDAAALGRPASFKVRTRHGDVQVLNRMPGIPPFTQLAADTVLIRLSDDAVAPVCSLGHLRAMKLAAGRPRDLADVAELDELHGAA